MAAQVPAGKRQRAEAYAFEAAQAERRGDHRRAAELYQLALLLLESSPGTAAVIETPRDRAESAGGREPELPDEPPGGTPGGEPPPPDGAAADD